MAFSIDPSQLTTASNRLAVIGNNITNSSVTGFQGQDFSAILSNAALSGSGTSTAGGRQLFSQGAIQKSSNLLDLAINGNGFFRLSRNDGKIGYTRDGTFQLDKNGFIVNPAGDSLTGYSVDSSGNIPSGAVSAIQISTKDSQPVATSSVVSNLVLDARSSVLGDGTTPTDANYTTNSGIVLGLLGTNNTGSTVLSENDKTILSNLFKTTVTVDSQTHQSTTILEGALIKLLTIKKDTVTGIYSDSSDFPNTYSGDSFQTSLDSLKYNIETLLASSSTSTTTPPGPIGFGSAIPASVQQAINNVYKSMSQASKNDAFQPNIMATANAFASALNTGINAPAILNTPSTLISSGDSTNTQLAKINNYFENVLFASFSHTSLADPPSTTTPPTLKSVVPSTLLNNLNSAYSKALEFGQDPTAFFADLSASLSSGGSSNPILNTQYDQLSHYAFDPTSGNSYNNSTSTTIYDGLGITHQLQTFYVKEPPILIPNKDQPTQFKTITQWNVYATVDKNPTDSTGKLLPNISAVGSVNGNTYDTTKIGPIKSLWFDLNGVICNSQGVPLDSKSASNINANVYLDNLPQSTPVVVDLSNTRQYATDFLVSIQQDGFPTGQFQNVTTDPSGVMTAHYSSGETKKVAQVVLATFEAPSGLKLDSNNEFLETYASGSPRIGAPDTGGAGQIFGSSLESAGVDLTSQMISLISAQRAYQANSEVVKRKDQILQTVIGIAQ